MSWYKRENLRMDDLNVKTGKKTLADEETFSLPAAKNGRGKIWLEDNSEECEFTFVEAGTITIKSKTENVATSDTASSLCIYAVSTVVTFKNNLGSEKVLHYDILHD
jgi:hypothetical protein